MGNKQLDIGLKKRTEKKAKQTKTITQFLMASTSNRELSSVKKEFLCPRVVIWCRYPSCTGGLNYQRDIFGATWPRSDDYKGPLQHEGNVGPNSHVVQRHGAVNSQRAATELLVD